MEPAEFPLMKDYYCKSGPATNGLGQIDFSRKFALANRETLLVPPIGDFVRRFLAPTVVSVDPFARNCTWATFTNDLNPNTKACYHLEALDFLRMLQKRRVLADVVLFDPPYNPAQAKECYEELGFKLPQRVAQTAGAWAAEKDVAKEILKPDGTFIWLGWNTCGMGIGRGFSIREIMLVNHGRGKHDTICMVERRAPPDAERVTVN